MHVFISHSKSSTLCWLHIFHFSWKCLTKYYTYQKDMYDNYCIWKNVCINISTELIDNIWKKTWIKIQYIKLYMYEKSINQIQYVPICIVHDYLVRKVDIWNILVIIISLYVSLLYVISCLRTWFSKISFVRTSHALLESNRYHK